MEDKPTLGEWSPSIQRLEGRHMIHIYGESGTGKSFIVMDILATLQKYIPQIAVWSPMNDQNHDYDKNGAVPTVFIHSTVDATVLGKIWERQSAARAAYESVNKPEVIIKLALLTGDPQYISHYEKISALLITADEEEKIVLETALHRVSKLVIAKYRDKLKKAALSEEEMKTIRRLGFNPRILLIFDDCTEQLRREKTDIFERLFYKGRHNLITTIVACHTDKTFTPELKKQTFLSIFTAKDSASAYIERPSTSYDKHAKKAAHAAAEEAFTPARPFQKLVLDRPTKGFYRYTAKKSEVKFCSPEIREYAERIRRPETESLRNNVYATKFN